MERLKRVLEAGKKEGNFATIDGRVVFMGGPGSGGGGTGKVSNRPAVSNAAAIDEAIATATEETSIVSLPSSSGKWIRKQLRDRGFSILRGKSGVYANTYTNGEIHVDVLDKPAYTTKPTVLHVRKVPQMNARWVNPNDRRKQE